jgi:peptidoglycan/LPS O-acetylase OafA/YrhL
VPIKIARNFASVKSPTVHFPNLDSVRALACLAVFICHCFDYLNNRQLSAGESWMYVHVIDGMGPMGVSLFFVLSGFLITYLLLREKDARQTIHVGFFYMKRILRIWPLFFLVVIVGFFILPVVTGKYDSQITSNHLPWFLTFTNNFDRIHSGFIGTGNNDSLGVLWSVAVEEQFYLLWPLVILLCSKRLFPLVAVGIIVGAAVFRYLHINNTEVLRYHSLSVAGDLATGGLAAYLGYYVQGFRNFFERQKTLQRGLAFTAIGLIVFNHHALLEPGANCIWGRAVLVLSFGWLISDQCYGKQNIFSLGRIPLLPQIGTISYGFYCFHMFAIIAMQKLNVSRGWTQMNGALFYTEFIVVFVLTFAVSWLSYRFFEKQFLRFRSRFDAMNSQRSTFP